MALTDLTNTKWVWNSEVDHDMPNDTYGIEILAGSAGTFYTYISLDTDDDAIYYGNNIGSTRVVNRGVWVASEDLKTIEITGGDDVTNTDFIAYLEANATQVFSTVDIKLGNNTLLGVDTIALTDATNTSNTINFTYGVTPSGTASVKLGDNTLTNVNTLSVLGTDDTYKSFGYAEPVSNVTVTFNLTFTTLANMGGLDFNFDEPFTDATNCDWSVQGGWGYTGFNQVFWNKTGNAPTMPNTQYIGSSTSFTIEVPVGTEIYVHGEETNATTQSINNVSIPVPYAQAVKYTITQATTFNISLSGEDD